MVRHNTATKPAILQEPMISTLRLLKNQAFVNGAWINARTGKRFNVNNPADGSEITTVPDFGAEDVQAAITAAAIAFKLWSAVQPAERAAALVRWAGLIRDNTEDLSILLTYEQGKPLAEAKAEVSGAADTIQWCAEEGRRLYGEYIDGTKPGTKIIVSRHPCGVVGAITPWNFPVGMITRKVGPALAAGCSVVLKPAEATPLCALALADLAQQAGLPDGVLNIVTSTQPAEAGKVLTSDVRVKKISFTGSTQVGRTLMGQAAQHIQKTSLELGGNAPFIVFSSADVEQAVAGAIASKFRNAGQTCICANRIYVHDNVYDQFLELFSSKIKSLKVGYGWAEGTAIGPLINDAAVQKIQKMIAQAVSMGGKIIAGGKSHPLGGTFFEPTLITGVPDGADIAQQEIFGPVAVLYKFSDESDIVARANDTPFGLSAYIYSQDLAETWRVSDGLEYGMVAINEPFLAGDLAPFGGVKESGIGREGGQYGLLEYIDIKYRLIGLN